ncbi:MAG TPA: hypothetical protein P5167_00370 [Bacteroidales bacterium]|nr:hypothetical protein [Bacteroidales bacterium]HRW94277.1 hypothetical protein [Bacteroidales bacterium]
MDKLKSFIQENRELFDSDPLPEGHELRFMQKLESRRSRKHNYLIYISVAALLLLVVTIGVRFLKEDPVSSLFYVDPCGSESYTCYYDQMQKLSEQIEYNTRELPDYQRQEILMNMESIMPGSPDEFSEMLPKDISSSEAVRLNKEYYQQLYEGMKQLASLTN